MLFCDKRDWGNWEDEKKSRDDDVAGASSGDLPWAGAESAEGGHQ